MEEEKRYYVDIPDMNSTDFFETWANVGSFQTREEAISFTREYFGSDEEGRIQIVTEG